MCENREICDKARPICFSMDPNLNPACYAWDDDGRAMEDIIFDYLSLDRDPEF